MLSRNVIYHGREEAPPKRIHLRAGPVSMVFEPETAFLRYIRLGDREIVRGIYAAVRDRHWRTITPRVSELHLEHADDAFRVTFGVECQERDVHFVWRGMIAGEADGTVTFAMEGVARSMFLRNRIGICVLHPIDECAGRKCVVEKYDGSMEEGEFPYYIKPHQPFTDMRAISHEVMPGVRAEVRFGGAVFEMEDQRNWTDASFKTYSGPLRRPFPVEVKKGTRIAQSVTVRLHGELPRSLPPAVADAPEVVLQVAEEPPAPLPSIGLGLASHGQSLSTIEVQRLRSLNLRHLRVDLKLADVSFRHVLERASDEAKALGLSLEIAAFVTDAADEQLEALAAEVRRIGPPGCAWLIFHEGEPSTTDQWARLARGHLAKSDPEAGIGAGSNSNFTELNRGRPGVEALDMVCYAINPQVHTSDSGSMVESLRTQSWTVESARQFVGTLPIAVTPVTLKRRFNPHLAGIRGQTATMRPLSQSSNSEGELPPQVDVRQMSLFGAAWTLGSIKYLSEGGADSITYFETTGWCGVMETEAGSPLPDTFRSIPGAVFPMYHVFADVGEFTGGRVIVCGSSAPLRVDGMVLEREGRRCVLLANMTPEAQEVRLVGHGLGERVRVRRLDETNAEQAMREPEAFRAAPDSFRHEPWGGVVAAAKDEVMLSLRPYAYVRMEAHR